MKYAILGDLHGCIINLQRIRKKLKQCEAIFITGDITGTISYPLIFKSILKSRRISREKYTELVYTDYLENFTSFQIRTAKRIFNILEKLEKPVFFTHGNSETAKVREYFKQIAEEKANFFYIGNSIETYNNLIVIGYGFCSPADYRTPLQTPGEKEIEVIEEDLAILEKQFNALQHKKENSVIGLFHEPPHNTKLDYIPKRSTHGGSSTIKNHISKIPYDFIFTGHIHESMNSEKLNSTIAINPGALVNRTYAIVNFEDSKVSFKKLRIPLSIKGLIYHTRIVFE
ncbi:MAG: metallophosphoesterase family protein [Candidatus Heimdallarchaeaceae archaeon]